jgi:hypothetical protein
MTAETNTLSYLARRGVSGQWRGFIRALVETLDGNLDAASRDSLLRAVGARLAALSPLPACSSLAELEARMNDVLAQIDWGFTEISFDPNERSLVLTHAAPPAIATAADPSGGWIAAVLEGMFGAWLGSQPGAEPSLSPRRVAATPAQVTLRYGRD